MIIQMTRITLKGNTYKTLLNTNYILEVMPAEDPILGYKSRVVYDSKGFDGPKIMYVKESLSTIRGLITRQANKEMP